MPTQNPQGTTGKPYANQGNTSNSNKGSTTSNQPNKPNTFNTPPSGNRGTNPQTMPNSGKK